MKIKQKYSIVHTTGAGFKRTKVGYIWDVVKAVRKMYSEDKIEIRKNQ